MKKLLAITAYLLMANSWSLDLMTYNTGLAHSFVAYAKERVPLLIDNLKKEQADIVCLQEVWNKADRTKFIKELKGIYPYSFQAKGEQQYASKAPVCAIGDLFGEGKFFTCVQKNCNQGDDDAKTKCYRTVCGPSLDALTEENRECAGALMSHVGKNIVQTMAALFRPLIKTTLFSYDGELGLLLLSKHKITDQKFIDWKKMSTLNHRGALMAKVHVEGKEHNVLCTHLTANLEETVPYTGIFEGWENEQRLQVDEMLSKYRTDGPTYMMGDFNCSFENSQFNISPEFQANCQRFVDAGFSDPMSEVIQECTFCQNNTLAEETKSTSIDHIFINNASIVDAKVVLKDVVTLDKKTKSSEEPIQSNLSDHYALKVTVE